ncbi:MAG: polysaccharide biosynthesis protein [Christensenellales bacterium]
MSARLGPSKGKSRILVLLLIDFLCVAASLVFFINAKRLPLFTPSEMAFAGLLLGSFIFLFRFLLRVYRQMWRYASSEVFLRMTVADTLGGLFYYLLDRLFVQNHMPLTLEVAAVATGLLVTLSSRFVYQTLRKRTNLFGGPLEKEAVSNANKINVGIVGAGELGVLLARELKANRSSRYHPYCFFDNDPRKIGSQIEGIPVYGPDGDIVSHVNAMPIQDIIIALPNMSPADQKEVFDTYKKTNCRVMLYDYPIDKVDVGQQKRTIREVKIEDLLFREMISLDDEATRETYHDKVILVTGAGGSIGSELCRQIAKMGPKRLVLLDVYENGVYEIQQELKRHHGDRLWTRTIIANICDARRMEEIFQKHKPDVVFHAAAHKHVPLMEDNCAEAVTNNVFGTFNVVNAAEKAGVGRFVMISTDKAVNPTNVMGATKRLCEIIIQSRKDSATDFVAVRFGNVLGSNGSVVPLFKKQIEEGGPVTITDKRIIRYFMAIPEAAQLVLRTGCRGEKGELYVLDMGKPVRILDLAENMISLSGFIPNKDIMIEEVGLRPGEKLYEELLIKTEECQKTSDERIFIERDTARSRDEVETMLASLQSMIAGGGTNQEIRECMMRLLPTYKSPEFVNQAAAESAEVLGAANHSYTDMAVSPGIPG